MQNIWNKYILEAVRHFVQILRESMLARAVVAIGIGAGVTLLSIIGLGREPQAITVFSEEKQRDTVKPEKRQVKTAGKVAGEKVLRDPFSQEHFTAKESKTNKGSVRKPEKQGKASQNIVREKRDKENTTHWNRQKSSRKKEEKTEVILRGILSNNGTTTALISIDGSQRLLEVGASSGKVTLLELTDREALIQAGNERKKILIDNVVMFDAK